jgi:hypothetical protein
VATLLAMTTPERSGDHALVAAGGHQVAGELLATLAVEHPVLASWRIIASDFGCPQLWTTTARRGGPVPDHPRS